MKSYDHVHKLMEDVVQSHELGHVPEIPEIHLPRNIAAVEAPNKSDLITKSQIKVWNIGNFICK